MRPFIFFLVLVGFFNIAYATVNQIEGCYIFNDSIGWSRHYDNLYPTNTLTSLSPDYIPQMQQFIEVASAAVLQDFPPDYAVTF